MVVVLISLMVGIAVPAFQAGLPTIRLRSASTEVAQFLYSARNQVERSQLAVQVQIDPGTRTLRRRALTLAGVPVDGEELQLSDDVDIVSISPSAFAPVAGPPGAPGVRALPPQTFFLYPGAAPPPIAVGLRNSRNARRWVRLDPITLSPVVMDREPGQEAAAAAERRAER